jgi:hypothetical protein
VTPAFVVPVVVWLVMCAVADADEPDLDVGTVAAGTAARVILTSLLALVIRWFYVRKREGRVLAPETVWIAAGFAALIAAGRLTN